MTRPAPAGGPDDRSDPGTPGRPAADRRAPVLYRRGRIHASATRDATAMLVDGSTVAWVGTEDAADGLVGPGTDVVDLEGALVTPAFVDAHVHLLDTGLQLLGPDLTDARSVGEVLDQVAAAARQRPGSTVLGHGWDETRLAEGRPPTMAELDRASGGVAVYLSRVDVHSAVVSGRLAAAAGVAGLPGWDGDGRVERAAHHAARSRARDLPPAQRRRAHATALRAAAESGVATVHEMSGPEIAGPDDLGVLVAVAGDVGVEVRPYWGARASADEEVADVVRGSGLDPADVAGLAGDLCVDGSIGSRTAALREPYADADTTGRLYLSVDEVAAHVAACGAVGVQAGFHVIGDAALDAVLDGLDAAADQVGAATVRRARVRLEHVEAADDAQVARLARHGATASMQPAFSTTWGGPDGMYARRLGARAGRLNRFASLASAGVPLAFGSDSPVTPFDPWGAVAAATQHEDPDERVSARAAFAAHTRGAHRAVDGSTRGGVVAVGATATFAVWEVGELVVDVPREGVRSWSTDPRSATPPLPDLSAGAPRPRWRGTVVAGRVVAAHAWGPRRWAAPGTLPGT